MAAVDLQSERVKFDDATGQSWVPAALLGLVGLAAAGILAFVTEDGPSDFYHSYLVSYMYFLSLALGALFFVLVAHLTRAGWSVSLRRLAEVVGWTVVPLAPLAVGIFFGMDSLYEWTDRQMVAADPVLRQKADWLDPMWFVVRLVFCFGVWAFLAIYFLRRSTEQDRTGDPELTLDMERASAPAMIAYALTVTLVAFDVLMSLSPHWYSTIYGVYYFAGCTLGYFALIPLLVGVLRRRGFLVRIVGVEHGHDLGKLIFAFVVFWAYIAFSQYMLIWYGNLPEETTFYTVREQGVWTSVSLFLLFGHFVLPFLWLISRHPKRRGLSLILAASWLLAMHWVDLFYLVMPSARPEGNPFRLMDLACFVGLGGLFVAFTFWRLRRASLIPVRDPRLSESLSFDNA